MKTPWWETTPGALQTLLATRQFVYVTLYTITLANSLGTIRTAVADFDVSIPGYSWPRNKPPIDATGSRVHGHWKAGLDVDTWQFRVAPNLTDPLTGLAGDLLGGQPWIAGASAGALDGALVQVDRAYMAAMPLWSEGGKPNVVGVLTIFYGVVAGVDPTETYIDITVNSLLELLNVSMPHNRFQAGCRFTLFSVGCGLSATTFAMTGTVSSQPTENTFTSSIAIPLGSGTYSLGRVVMTSGANAGFSRSVRNWTGGVFTLLSPFPYALANGDNFMAYPGCDKTVGVCTAFGNLSNFGGEPYIPDAVTAV